MISTVSRPVRPAASRAASRARAVLGGGHRGRLVTASGPAPVGYLDDDGQPVVVVPWSDAAAADGAATLMVTGVEGIVLLRGLLRRLLGPANPAEHHPVHPVHMVLADHVGCLLGLLAAGPVAYSRLELSEVAFGDRGAQLHAVPLTAYATAGTEPAQVR